MKTAENKHLILGFSEETGALVRLYSKDADFDFISADANCGSTFAIYADFFESYRFKDHFRPEDPAKFCKTMLLPQNPVFKKTDAENLTVTYSYENGLCAELTVSLFDTDVRFGLELSNKGSAPISLLPQFPVLRDITLDDSGRMLGVNQAGATDTIWNYPGGVYGNAADQSAQLGCMFHENKCLGFYIEDPTFAGKHIIYKKPDISVSHFPDKTLAQGEKLTLPCTVISASSGTWHSVAKKYADWMRANFDLPEIPDHIRQIDSYHGMWFEKKGKPNSNDGPLGQPLEKFEELTVHFDEYGSDTIEYAFFSQLSASEKPMDFGNCCGSIRRHTDGVNIVREDLGGAEGLRRGIDLAHKKGKKVMLYVEGLIVPKESSLFSLHPEAKNWLYKNPDGSNLGTYTQTDFVHMCCGCEEWQDHLAQTCKRLMIETNADGIRLESFAFYHWPCYEPTHNHESPFDSNKWMLRLLEKVRKAVCEVKPDAILATEAACDFYRLFFNTALDQYFDPVHLPAMTEDCSVFRVMFPEFYIPRINGGPVLESMQLMPDGCRNPYAPKEELRLFDNWKKARGWFGKIFTHGNVVPAPACLPNKDLRLRILESDSEMLLIAAAPKLNTEGSPPVVGLKEDPICCNISIECPFTPEEIREFNIDTGSETKAEAKTENGTLTWQFNGRWSCLLIKKQN